MRLHIIAVSQKAPSWVEEAFAEYHKRFTKESPCLLTEIPLQKRNKNISATNITRLVQEEGLKIQNAIPKQSKTVALDVKGTLWSTEQLAQHLARWQQETSAVNFLIGGPEGLSQECLEKADYRWSLSPLTFPHPMVRLMLVEQLYRALCILKGHPYHRG